MIMGRHRGFSRTALQWRHDLWLARANGRPATRSCLPYLTVRGWRTGGASLVRGASPWTRALPGPAPTPSHVDVEADGFAQVPPANASANLETVKEDSPEAPLADSDRHGRDAGEGERSRPGQAHGCGEFGEDRSRTDAAPPDVKRVIHRRSTSWSNRRGTATSEGTT